MISAVSEFMQIRHVFRVGSWVSTAITGAAFLGACASTGTNPNAMTANQHEAAADAEGKVAAGHQSQYDPAQTKVGGPPAPSPGAYTGCAGYSSSSNCYVQWKSTENVTEQHLKTAGQHRKLAEKHRAGSQSLRDAEQRFCSGISEADRDVSPFSHREDITTVEVLNSRKLDFYGQAVDPGVGGARIVFRAVSGMSAELLQREVDCHLARNAVMGTSDQTMAYCPLGVARASAIVTSTGSGFAVDVSSDNKESVKEIVKRAQALVAARN